MCYDRLLTEQDNDNGYFDFQISLLKLMETDKSKIIDLALLQAIDPHARYDVAIDLLKYATTIISDIRVSIIGFYLSIMWIGEVDHCFRQDISRLYNACDIKTRSLIDYLIAYEYYLNKNQEESLKYLRKSLLFSGHVKNHLLYAKFCNKQEKRKEIETAKRNIIIAAEKNTTHDISFYVDPDNYIAEFISGISMPIETFES